jgi:serine/threonine-protein kinase
VQGAKANDVAVADLVPVHEVVPRPPSPALPWLAALALLLVAVAVALAGVGSPPRVGGDARPRIIVGTPDDKGDAVVDLSKPVPVVGSVVPEAAGADSVQVALGVDKLDLAEATVPLPSGPDGRFATEVDLTGRRFLVTGTVEARVRFLSGGRVVAQRALPVKTSPRSLLTVPGGLALALVLLVFAYAESILRSMRRGRKAVTGPPGLAVVGALAGALAVVGAWVAADVEVTRGSLVACAVLGAASGLAAAWGARRLSRRAPARRR